MMARRRTNAQKHRVGIVRLPRAVLSRSTALQGVAVLCAVLPAGYVHAQPAPNAHPQNPVTQLGSGSYSYNGTTTTINQKSQNLATGWSSFNVGSAQSVQINQPNTRAISVNRVAAGDPSQIAGHINANGVFVLVNPAGVVFSQGAQVNAASVIVSTADVANKNLAAGKLIFDQPGKPGAMVVNKGNITVKQTGLAALVAPGVANSGTISAPFGRVALAGGEASVVDLYGDGLMSIDVTKQVTSVPNGPDGKPVPALVTNSGVIKATGGRIELSARAVDGIVTNLVDAGGKIEANTAPNGQAGTVVINGIGGSLSIEGDISAAGKAPGSKGGSIELNASNAVNVASTARVNASGKAGGGTVAIGTSLARAAGGPSVTGAPTAKTVTVAQGAKVTANATKKGSGGRVTVLSTDNTDMGGLIEARGGPLGGDGGFVEVSGDTGFSLTGGIDVTAAMGNAGTILLDPTNLTIVSGTSGTTGLNGTLDSTNTVAVGDGGLNGTVTTGEIASLSGNIILQAGSQLTFSNNASVTLKNNANLILTTGSGDITTNTGADITAKGSGGITLLAGTSGVGSINLNSDLTTGSNGGVSLQASGSIALNAVSITTGTLDITNSGTGAITQSSGGVVDVDLLKSSGGAGGTVTLAGVSNSIGTLGNFAAAGNFGLNTTGTLLVAGSVSAGSGNTLFLASPTLTLGNSGTHGILAAPSGTVSVSTDKLSVGSAGGTLTASGGVVEIAPQSSIAVAFGTTSSAGTLGIPTQLSVTATTLRLGEAMGATTASAIKIATATSLATVGTIDFETGGAVTQAGSLAGVAISGNAGTIVLGNSDNALTSVGNLTGTTGVTLTNSGSLPINGLLSTNGRALLNAGGAIGGAGSVAIGTLAGSAAAAITLTGSVGSVGNVTSTGFTLTNGGSLSVDGVLNAGSAAAVINIGTFGFSDTGTILGNTVSIAAGTIGIAGSIGAASLLTLNASAAGVTQTAGFVSAGTLAGSAGTAATLNAGSIASVGSFTTGSGFTLTGNTSTLAVNGLIDGNTGSVVLNNGSLGLTVASGSTIHGAEATLVGGSITLGGKIDVSGLLNVAASAGAIRELSGAILKAGALTGSSFTDTALILGSNTIGTLGSFTAGGSFTLADTAALLVNAPVSATAIALSTPMLTLGDGTDAGTLAASSGPVSIQTGSLAVGTAGGAIDAGATGTIEFAPETSGDVIVLGTGGAGTLAIDPSASGLTLTYGTLRLGAVNGTTVAGSIVVAAGTGTYTIPGTLDLEATGGVTQTTSLTATELTGAVGSVTLNAIGNQIGTIGDLTSVNGFSLAHNTGGVTIAGTLNVNAGTIVIGDDTSVSLSGSATATSVTLTAPDLVIGGTLNATTAALFATTGSIDESAGTMNLVTLTGSAATGAMFTGTNAIGTLGAFAATDIVLNDGSSDLTVAGAVTYGHSA
ncbi:MAG TPA: filamentous hemagglutinin N-terminal domain-containing protein, partial [Rhodopila sp.]|nr:filamentous hemagglutinin N-terminal domain-containing protein [Rhodopila sp.]